MNAALTHDWTRLTGLLSQQGAAATLRTVADAALWRYWPPRRRFMQELLRQRLQDQAWDREHGVETAGEVSLTDAGVPPPAASQGNGLYRGVWIDLFQNAMQSLALDFEEFTFVDFGSGKGKALLLASDYPFQEIVGVEYARPLHEAAVENIRRYRSASQRCTRLTSLCCDVRDYTLAASPAVCFFFNPMATPQLRRTFEQIVASAIERPRPIYVVYLNPRNVNEHRPAFDALAPWAPLARQPTFEIYGVGDAAWA